MNRRLLLSDIDAKWMCRVLTRFTHLEVVSEGPVTQHLEESVVVGVFTDIV